MSEYGVDLAAWYAAGRWVAILDFLDGLPSACRLNEAISNDPETAQALAAMPKPADPWAPRVSEFDLNATMQREILHALMALRMTMLAVNGQRPGDLEPFPGPRTRLEAALADADRAATVALVELFGFTEDHI